jgi:ankyrin repeat protein
MRDSDQIGQVRGLNLFLSDLSFEKDEISTIMWNPLHFAVFNKHLDIVRYFISDLKVSIKTIGPKATYENEKDPTNLDTFPEDKIILLLLAVETRNKQMLQYLLDELHYFWYSEFVVD